MTAFELYLRIGFEHIIDRRLYTDIMAAEGYDHLLFVVALAAVYHVREYKKVLILVTAFTIGHSFTLALATLDMLRIPSDLIEFLIPLTIFATALYNIIKRQSITTPGALRLRYGAALLFGLIHGMGFSNYLKALLGTEDQLLIPLLGFNVGLEVGQLLIVVVVLFLFYILHRLFGLSRTTWILIVSIVVLGLTLPILLEKFGALV